MTVKRDAPVQPLVDPAVRVQQINQSDPVQSGAQKMQQVWSLTPGKAKKKARDKARKKVTFDWPEWLIEQLQEIAGQEGETFPMNQLAAVLAIEGLRQALAGNLDLEGRKIPSKTPAFTWFLEVEDEDQL